MGSVHTFRPRPAARLPLPPSPAEMRTMIEEAAVVALDTAERLLAILDALDGDADLEDSGDAEPSLGAPEGHPNQVAWLRGTGRDLELDQQQDFTR